MSVNNPALQIPSEPVQRADDLEYTKKARHGHGKDVTDTSGVRQVAGCLPIDPVNRRFLLVSSRKKPGAWVIVSIDIYIPIIISYVYLNFFFVKLYFLFSLKVDGKRMKHKNMLLYVKHGKKQVLKVIL